MDYTVFDEEYRTLYYEKNTRNKREAAVKYVKDKISKETDLLLEEIGADSTVINGLLSNDSKSAHDFSKILKATREKTNISFEAIKKFDLMSCIESEISTAYEDIRNVLLDKCLIDFAKRAELYPNTWNRFLSYEYTTTDGAVRKIEKALNLTEEECIDFEEKVLKDKFTITKQLSEKSIKLFESRNIPWSTFMLDADVTESVYKTIKKTGSKIQQKTLLKLLIGFRADDSTAKEYMEIAGSGFYRVLDIIFKVCIRMGYTNRYVVEAVIDRFAARRVLHSKNPYNN